jgi:hypothetical protein
VLRKLGQRMPFVVAVALIAAALGDPIVETISNTGVLGRGYADNNHSSVVPTLVAGAALVLLLICKRCLQLLRSLSERETRLLYAAPRRQTPHASLADFPYVLILQFVALFLMESAEQLVFSGRLAGGTEWLGGPIWFSVLAHAAIGLACTVIVARAMRALVHRCATLVVTALELNRDAFRRGISTLFVTRVDESARFRIQILHVHQLGERAPPLLVTLT